VLWPELGGNVAVLLLVFDSFANDRVPGLTAQLFRLVASTRVLVGRQGSKGFSLARSAQQKCVRLRYQDIHSKEPRWEVLAGECK